MTVLLRIHHIRGGSRQPSGRPAHSPESFGCRRRGPGAGGRLHGPGTQAATVVCGGAAAAAGLDCSGRARAADTHRRVRRLPRLADRARQPVSSAGRAQHGPLVRGWATSLTALCPPSFRQDKRGGAVQVHAV